MTVYDQADEHVRCQLPTSRCVNDIHTRTRTRFGVGLPPETTRQKRRTLQVNKDALCFSALLLAAAVEGKLHLWLYLAVHPPKDDAEFWIISLYVYWIGTSCVRNFLFVVFIILLLLCKSLAVDLRHVSCVLMFGRSSLGDL